MPCGDINSNAKSVTKTPHQMKGHYEVIFEEIWELRDFLQLVLKPSLLHQRLGQRFPLCRRQLHSQKFGNGGSHVEAESLGEFRSRLDAVT